MESELDRTRIRAVALAVIATGLVVINWYMKTKRRLILSRRNRLMVRGDYGSRLIYQSDKKCLEMMAQSESILSPSSCPTRGGQKKKRNREGQTPSEIQVVAQHLGEVALALNALNTDREMNFANSLYREVMSLEGYTDTMKCMAYDYLMENNKTARGFMAKTTEHRQIWIDGFLMTHAPQF